MSVRKHTSYLAIAAFVLGGIALFSSRAVYIDEPVFLALAQTPRHYGLLFEEVYWTFFGIRYPLFGGGSHPPAVVYYLSALYSILGQFDAVLFRLSYSVFGLAAAFGFYGLAKRSCVHPLGVTLLFVASPAFFVMMQTLMMDVPTVAFLLLGLHYFAPDESGEWHPFRAAVCFSLSVLTGYTALIPLGCLFVTVLLARQPRSRLAVIAAAPGALVLWLAVMLMYYGKDPLTPVVEYFVSNQSIAHNILAAPSFLGGVAMLPWLFVLLLRREADIPLVTRILPVSAGWALFLSLFVNWTSTGYGLWFILLASSGTAMVLVFGYKAAAIFRSLRSGDASPLELFLALWFPATLLFFVLVAQFITARYLLLALPALYLLLFARSSLRSIVAVGAPTLLVSLAVATADYRFVNAYPKWVSETVAPLHEKGVRVLGAAESGLRFYLEKQNVPTLVSTDLRVKDGDWIVRHSTLFKYGLGPEIETRLDVLQNYELNDRFPVRTFSHEAGAGFHGSSLGLVPYTLSRAPYDRLEIAEVHTPTPE